MDRKFTVPDVSAELVMDVAKILANSTSPMGVDEVLKCFVKVYNPNTISLALDACCQLDLAVRSGSSYVASPSLQSDIKHATRDELYVPFQARLKQYPPFLLYIDFASKGYSSKDAASRSWGILTMGGSSETAEKSLRRWGVFSRLIDYDAKTASVKVKIAIEKFSAEYVLRLLGAFGADLKSRLFLLDMVGADAFAHLEKMGIRLDELSSALLEYETDSQGATAKATQMLEFVLWKMAESLGLDLSESSGLAEVADLMRSVRAEDQLKRGKAILTNQLHVVHGMGGIRNMSHHDPDKETGVRWRMTKEAALLTTLFVPVIVRSLYLYQVKKEQVF